MFAGLPWSVYAPAAERSDDRGGRGLRAGDLLRAGGRPAARRASSRPSDVGTLTRGTGTNARHIRNILPEDAEAESLLVVEVITPGGHWSSYPPHKHDRDALPDESYLEETYYHRLSPPQGFAFQRVYTDDRSLDETMAVGDRDVVLVPRGYHPGRRAPRLRPLLSQHDGRPEAHLALPQRPGA